MAEQIKIEIEPPDVWTLEHWEIYTNATQQYYNKMAEKKMEANLRIAQFHGAVELINRGVFKVRNSSRLRDLVREQAARKTRGEDFDPALPGNIVQFVGSAVADYINKANADPLDSWIESSPTSTTSSEETTARASKSHAPSARSS